MEGHQRESPVGSHLCPLCLARGGKKNMEHWFYPGEWEIMGFCRVGFGSGRYVATESLKWKKSMYGIFLFHVHLSQGSENKDEVGAQDTGVWMERPSVKDPNDIQTLYASFGSQPNFSQSLGPRSHGRCGPCPREEASL